MSHWARRQTQDKQHCHSTDMCNEFPLQKEICHTSYPLQWGHNGRDGVSNHQRFVCLLNRLLRRRSKKTSKLHLTGLCEGNPPVTRGCPSQTASNAENASIWWRHHGDAKNQRFKIQNVPDIWCPVAHQMYVSMMSRDEHLSYHLTAQNNHSWYVSSANLTMLYFAAEEHLFHFHNIFRDCTWQALKMKDLLKGNWW